MKLVRDLIPEIIQADGRACQWRTVKDRQEHIRLLKAKIVEETNEFIENPCIEEAADILEVLGAFIALNDLEFTEVLDAATKKFQERGGFTGGIILEKSDPRAKLMWAGMEWGD